MWAIEGARGLGALVAQQLVAAGETVLDVPAKLSTRVRVLDNECADKNDTHDAALRCDRRDPQPAAGRRSRPRTMQSVLRMLAKRHHDLIGRRTQSICRLHALLATMTAGGLPRLLSADRAAQELRRIRPVDAVGIARRHAAVELLGEVRDADRQLAELRTRIVAAVHAADTTVTNVYGVGPIVAAYLIGYTGDVTRFATRAPYARYNATAPLDASSGPNPRHRLNDRGNRQLNHALHIAAVTQISHDTAGRAYYQRKQAERHSDKEALRALKRRISDAVYAAAARRRTTLNQTAGPGGQPGTTLESSVAGESLKPALRNSHSRTRTTRYDQTPRHATGRPRAPKHPRTLPLDTNRLRSGVILRAQNGGGLRGSTHHALSIELDRSGGAVVARAVVGVGEVADRGVGGAGLADSVDRQGDRARALRRWRSNLRVMRRPPARSRCGHRCGCR